MGFFDKVKDAFTGKDEEAARDTAGDTAADGQSDGKSDGWGESIQDAIQDTFDQASAAEEQPPGGESQAGEPQGVPGPPPAADEAPRDDQARHRDEPKHEQREAKHKPEHRTVTVKSGDTLSEIAQKYGVDWREMARLNHLENPDLIYPGQVFKIPHN